MFSNGKNVILGIPKLFTILIEKRSILILHCQSQSGGFFFFFFFWWLILLWLGKQRLWSTGGTMNTALIMVRLHSNVNLCSMNTYTLLTSGEVDCSEKLMLV